MKKLLVAAAFILFAGTGINSLHAQVNVSINIGAQPVWGPVGYNYVDYYYLPDIEAYYSVPQRQYIYLDGPSWVFSPNLPPRYSSYDIYRGYKVVINEPKPYLNHTVYKVKYQKYKGNYGKQVIIKNQKYKQNGNKQGKGKSKGKGKKHG